jgi:hypothetical protein
MSTLEGQSINQTYKDLLQVSNSNSGVDGTLRAVEDGEGTVSALEISTTDVRISNLTVTGTVTGLPSSATNLSATANGTSLTVNSDTGTNASIPAASTSAWGAMTDEDKGKLDGIEATADITDATNVQAAGALMDNEVTNLAQVKAFDSSDYATATQGALADSAIQPSDLGSAATTDSTDYATSAQGALADSAVQPSDLGSAATTDSTAYATSAQGALADSAVQNGDSSLNITSSTNAYVEIGGAAGNVSFIDLKNPSTQDYDLRIISDDQVAMQSVHTSRARIEGHESLGFCAGNAAGGAPIPEVVTVTSSGVRLRGDATQLYFEDTDELGTPTEIVLSLNQKALRFGFQDSPNTQAFAIFGRNLTIAGGTVAEMNALTADDGALQGQIAYVSNGNAGSPCLAMYIGNPGAGAWKVLAAPGANISA